uniref:RNA polymerase II subunit A C-terminal domain phosphatase SSU72 n=1 Tax=Heterorhabditis bacteriophora TaxID=37862 RepID=A0A1I7X1Z3_HETBA
MQMLRRKRGFNVESYGSGNQVKLPGTAIDKPNCYEFGKTTYDYIYTDLKNKDSAFYTQNGLLNMLDRNRRIKECPQKFQHETKEFDVIICLEERVYDQVSGNPVHVINIDIEDNPEEATIGAWFVCDLCAKVRFTLYDGTLVSFSINLIILTRLTEVRFWNLNSKSFQLEKCDDLDNEIDEILGEFEAKNQRRNILHTICFY